MKDDGRLTDRQLEDLLIGMLREGSAPNTYRSGIQEAAAITMCINGGDLDTKKRIARLLLNVMRRLDTAEQRKAARAKKTAPARSTVPEDFVTGGTWKEVGRKD